MSSARALESVGGRSTTTRLLLLPALLLLAYGCWRNKWPRSWESQVRPEWLQIECDWPLGRSDRVVDVLVVSGVASSDFLPA